MSINGIFPREIMIDAEPTEFWNYIHPKRGDHIRVCRGLYNHHGIYIADDEVIHFTGTDDDSILDWSNAAVIKTDLKGFLRGDTLETKEYTADELQDVYPVEQIVLYAQACLGDKNYNLVFNNCEHFANTCTLGRFRSRQVEKFFGAVVNGDIVLGGKDMSFWGSVGGFFKGLFGGGSSGSRSTSNTTYEPDKVKVAQIEADTRLRLADMENERIEIMKNARLEMLEFETKSNLALEEARARGLQNAAQIIVAMQERLNEVAEKRLRIIEKGSLQLVKEIEGFYQELSQKVDEDNDKYSMEKLPKLLCLLENYEVGTPSHSLYLKRIEDDMALQAKHYIVQLEAVAQRQGQIISGLLQSKDRIMEQTAQLTASMIENISGQYAKLPKNEEKKEETLFLPEANIGMIGAGK